MIKHTVQRHPGERREQLDLVHDIHAVGLVRRLPVARLARCGTCATSPAALHGPPGARGLEGDGRQGRLRGAPRRPPSQILEEHHPEPLPGDVADQVDAVLRDAEVRAGIA